MLKIKIDYNVQPQPEGFLPLVINGVKIPYHHPYNVHPYCIYNNNIAAEKVVSFDDIIEYKENCFSIMGKWYIKGVHIKINNDNTGWVKIKKAVRKIKGITGFDSEGQPIHGYFFPDKGVNCLVNKLNSFYICNDYRILPKSYVEQYSTGVFYNTENLSPDAINKLGIIENNPGVNVANYVIEDSDNFNDILEYYNNSLIKIDRDLKYINSYISPFTFGLEYESVRGNLPVHLQYKYGVVICKDGSLKNEKDNVYPPEYVTVPFCGAKGLQTIRDLSKDLSLRNLFDNKCSLHIHIGGFQTSRLFIISLFKLCYKIQNDLYKMFPGYKSNELRFKKQEYCKKLPDILPDYGSKNFNEYVNDTYKDLFLYITQGIDSCKQYNRTNKKNPFGSHKWNIPTRYHWVNFTNIFFNNRDTIEFRLHTPTFNSDKSINWLLMCIAIIKYAQKYPIECISDKNISFKNVLNYYKNAHNTEHGAKLSENLINYYNNRVSYFEMKTKKGDMLCIEEQINDKDFKFNTTEIS